MKGGGGLTGEKGKGGGRVVAFLVPGLSFRVVVGVKREIFI